MPRRLLIAAVLFLAGGACAGEALGGAEGAWLAEYRLRDGRGDRILVVARNDDRIEYRMTGEPTRVWRRGREGLEHEEIFVADQRMVSYTTGDLLALGRMPKWEEIGSIVDPALCAHLHAAGGERSVGGIAHRCAGTLAGAPIDLAWLPDAGLPAHYRHGAGDQRIELVLRTLSRVEADAAFTSTDGLRETDYADIGDMELDPFARRYILMGSGESRPAF